MKPVTVISRAPQEISKEVLHILEARAGQHNIHQEVDENTIQDISNKNKPVHHKEGSNLPTFECFSINKLLVRILYQMLFIEIIIITFNSIGLILYMLLMIYY